MFKLKDADLLPWVAGLLADALKSRTSEALNILIETSEELIKRGYGDIAGHIKAIVDEEFPHFITPSNF
jgi:hypothetical protein